LPTSPAAWPTCPKLEWQAPFVRELDNRPDACLPPCLYMTFRFRFLYEKTGSMRFPRSETPASETSISLKERIFALPEDDPPPSVSFGLLLLRGTCFLITDRFFYVLHRPLEVPFYLPEMGLPSVCLIMTPLKVVSLFSSQLWSTCALDWMCCASLAPMNYSCLFLGATFFFSDAPLSPFPQIAINAASGSTKEVQG